MAPWSPSDVITVIGAWTLMMAIMMLPSIIPWLLAYRRNSPSSSLSEISLFGLGYILAWSAFSVAAGLTQWLMHDAALLSVVAESTSPVNGSALFILAGLFQWTSVKERCLTHCQSPLGYFLSSWRPGKIGAISMGARHGLYCVGCCWALMMLAFVAGIMNILWMLTVTVFVFVDHALLKTTIFSRLVGTGLLAWGIWTFIRV